MESFIPSMSFSLKTLKVKFIQVIGDLLFWELSILICNNHLLKLTITQVMLSQPIPPDEATSDAIILSNISSITWECFSFFLINSPTKSTDSCDVRQSHMPSQAKMRNYVSPVILSFLTSGTAVII